MHEVSLMEQTLEIAIESARQQGASKIHRLTMRIGAMSGVVPEALTFAFDIVAQETIAADAKLDIESVPVLCFCPSCTKEFNPPDLFYECPNCGELRTKLVSGKEIELKSLEVS